MLKKGEKTINTLLKELVEKVDLICEKLDIGIKTGKKLKSKKPDIYELGNKQIEKELKGENLFPENKNLF